MPPNETAQKRLKDFIIKNGIKKGELTGSQATQIMKSGTYDGFVERRPQKVEADQNDLGKDQGMFNAGTQSSSVEDNAVDASGNTPTVNEDPSARREGESDRDFATRRRKEIRDGVGLRDDEASDHESRMARLDAFNEKLARENREERETGSPSTPEFSSEDSATPAATGDNVDGESDLVEDTSTGIEIKDIASFKQAGGGINELETLIENRYGADAIVDGNTITADINGERFQWNIDSAGNPIRTSMGRIDSEEFLFGQQNGIPTSVQNGQVTFSPKNIDQAFDLYNRFGKNVNIGNDSIDNIKASTQFDMFQRYKGADSDVLLQGMRNGEIGVGGETWNVLTKINGGEETGDMIVARQQYENEIKLSNVNNSNKIISDSYDPQEGFSIQESQVIDQIRELDQAYDESVQRIYDNVDLSYSDFKSQNNRLRDLNNDLNDLDSKIDEINVAKRDIMDEIRDKYPNMDLGSQIELYNQRSKAFDDQLFVLQRDYSNKVSEYNFEDAQLKSEYNHIIQKSERQLQMLNTMYGTERGDLLNERIFARQDRLLNEQIQRAKDDKKQAIIDNDVQRAKEFAYSVAMMEEQLKLNKKYSDGIVKLGGSAYLEPDPITGELILKGVDTNTSSSVGGKDTNIGTSNGDTYRGFSISQDYGASDTPNQNDIAQLANGQEGTPGVDFAMPVGTPVKSFTGGKVVAINDDPDGYGNQVIIDDGSNLHLYNHLDSTNLTVGTEVVQGDIIAKSGNTGFSTGPHLDYRVSSNGQTSLSGAEWIDPKQFINFDTDDRFGGFSILEIKQTLSQVPATLKNAIEEKKDWEKTAVAALNQTNGDVGEALLLTAGWNITNPNNKEIANKLGNILKSTNSDEKMNIGGKASLINSDNVNDLAKGIRSIESFALRNNENISNNNFTDSSKVIEAYKAVKEIEDKINELGPSYFGLWDGTVSSLESKLQDSPEFVSTLSDIENFLGPIRTERFGVNLTENEGRFVDNFMPDVKNPDENIKQKLNSLLNSIVRGYNSGRVSTGLPELTIDQIVNDSSLVDFYRGSSSDLSSGLLNDLGNIDSSQDYDNDF